MRSSDWDNIAGEYHKEVISPFQQGVINPLFSELRNIPDTKKKVIADIGCGRGETLDLLSKNFKEVYALDFSNKMIEIAKANNSAKNIVFKIQDMTDMPEFKERFDVVISVNSVLLPEITNVKKALGSIYSTIKPGGKFFGIFPAMETILYQSFLILEKRLDAGVDETKALHNARRILEARKYDFITATYAQEKDIVQKFYYDFELKIRLKKAGFKNIKIKKVLYPWSKEVSDYENFPDMPKMWDWFVEADK